MEAKEILEALDLGDDVSTLEQLKERHGKKFITISTAHEQEEVRSKVIGKINGSLTTHLKKAFELSPEEIKDKKIEEVIELISGKTKTKISELESGAGRTKDEAVKDLEAKLEKAQKNALDFKGAAELAARALQEKEGLFETEKKGWKVNSLISEVKKDFEKELRSDINPLEKEGFESHISKNFIIDLDETGESLAVYDKDKKRVADPKKLGSFLSPKDLLISEAAKYKLVRMNDGKTVTKVLSDIKAGSTDSVKKSNINPDSLPPLVRARMEKQGLL